MDKRINEKVMSKVEHNKKALLKALEESLGIVTIACKSCGVGRSSYYEYYSKDKKFKKSVDDIENITLDFVESKLLSQIKENNPTSTIFYLKTKGKKRGYIEPQHEKNKETEKKEPFDIDINKLPKVKI